MSSPEVYWTQEVIQDRLQKLQAAQQAADRVSEQRQAYCDAACVLAYFDAERLQPLPPQPPHEGELKRMLDQDCAVVYDENRQAHWALRDDVRAAALQHLGSREALLAALEANPERPKNTLQTILESYIRGDAAPLDRQTADQLGDTLQVVRWLSPAWPELPELPGETDVYRRIELEALLKPFHFLADNHFHGRKAELARLWEYVRDIKHSGALVGEQHPLMIHAPGGMGKSTLIAKFILEIVALDEPTRLPFAYIDLERHDIVADEPLTLLAEVVRQIGIQYPAAYEVCEALREQWLQHRLQSTQDAFQAVQNAESGALYGGTGDAATLIGEFLERYGTIGISGRPLLLILDTFETIQIHNRDAVDELGRFLFQLQEALPDLRPVILGRAPVAEFPTEDWELKGLDDESAQKLLADNGVADQELARRVVQQVGGNPLSLRLAIDLLHKEGAGPEGIKDLHLGRFLIRLEDYIIQGQLYWRILGHIRNQDVRKLAHPGLVLRRVTAELIAEVLAEPCEIALSAPEQSVDLFNRLKREVALVTEVPGDVLVHRPDVRLTMLKLLQKDRPAVVDEIHRRAIAYYARQPGAPARAEELYHRLMLEQPREELDAHWVTDPEVERSLHGTFDELPPRAKNYLAAKTQMRVDTDAETRRLADQFEWEHQIERRVRERLERAKPDAALKLLDERPPHYSPGSPLYRYRAAALERLGKLEEARRTVDEGVASHATLGTSAELFQLLRVSAWLYERLGNRHQALADLVDARRLADRYGDDLARLEIGASRLRLGRAERSLGEAEQRQIADELMTILRAVSDQRLEKQPQLVRALLRELGAERPEMLARALPLLGLSTATREQFRELGRVLAMWDAEVSAEAGEQPGMLARTGGLPVADSLEQAWFSFVFEASPTTKADVISRLAAAYPPIPQPVIDALVDILRGAQVELVGGRESLRNGRQLKALKARALRLASDDPLFGSSLGWAYRAYTVRRHSPDDQPSASGGDAIYLFNLLVALEWQPAGAERRHLEAAFRRASDELYRLTGGQMAFGQVVFGGAELSDCADILITASNRRLPTSPIGGLHDEERYAPILLGRTLWRSGRTAPCPWDDPNGYREIVHQWAHYALRLIDPPPALIGLAAVIGSLALSPAPSPDASSPFTIAVPAEENTPALLCAREAPGDGELLARLAQERAAIQDRYRQYDPAHGYVSDEPPLPLPRYGQAVSEQLTITTQTNVAQVSQGAKVTGVSISRAAALLLERLPEGLRPDDVRVYVFVSESSAAPHAPPTLLDQGAFDEAARAAGLRLLGAKPGDSAVLVGAREDGRPAVLRGTIAEEGATGDWRDVTPPAGRIAVLPELTAGGQIKTAVVRGDGPAPDELWVMSVGGKTLRGDLARAGASTWESKPLGYAGGAGYIFARWDEALAIVPCVLNDGSATGDSSPLVASSPDGEAVLYIAGAYERVRYGGLRMAVTRQHGPIVPPPGARPLGATFAVAISGPLAPEFSPTLAFYPQLPNQQERATGDLLIYRLVGDAWIPLLTYAPPEGRYAAAPLTAQSAGSLLAPALDGPRVEYFSMCLVPRDRKEP